MPRYHQGVLVSCEIPWDEQENLLEDVFRQEVRGTIAHGFRNIYVFGTDAPLYLPAPFTCVLETLPISDEVREKIAWRNVLSVIPALAGRSGVPKI